MKTRVTLLALSLFVVWAMSPVQSQNVPRPKATSARAQLLSKLEGKVSITGKRIPLQVAIQQVAEQANLKVEIDGNSLKFEGYTKNMPRNLDLKQQPARLALAAILSPFQQLVIVADAKGESLIVTTSRGAGLKRLVPLKLTHARARWSVVMTATALEQLTQQTMARIKEQVATPREFQQRSKQAQSDAAVLAFLAFVVEDMQPAPIRWTKNANAVRASATQMHAAIKKSGPKAFVPAKAAADLLVQILEGKPFKSAPKAEPFDLDELLPSLMVRNHQAQATLKMILSAPDITPKQAQSARNEAAWIGSIANALQMRGHSMSDDDDWLEHAEQLETNATRLLKSKSIRGLDKAIAMSGSNCGPNADLTISTGRIFRL